MSVALILGGAGCLAEDVAAYTGPYHGVLACNEAGAWWGGPLTAWVSLHAERFDKWRKLRGGPDPDLFVTHLSARSECNTKIDLRTDYLLPGMQKCGSSGLFAAKVALVDLGFDFAVLCGVPMVAASGHFFDPAPWKSAGDFARQWEGIAPEYRARMRSMSGWSRDFLGAPEFNGQEANHEADYQHHNGSDHAPEQARHSGARLR